jgi:hypothetical protein
MKNYDEMTVEEFLQIMDPNICHDEYLKYFDEQRLKAKANQEEYTEHPVEHLLSLLRMKKMLNDFHLKNSKT